MQWILKRKLLVSTPQEACCHVCVGGLDLARGPINTRHTQGCLPSDPLFPSVAYRIPLAMRHFPPSFPLWGDDEEERGPIAKSHLLLNCVEVKRGEIKVAASVRVDFAAKSLLIHERGEKFYNGHFGRLVQNFINLLRFLPKL